MVIPQQLCVGQDFPSARAVGLNEWTDTKQPVQTQERDDHQLVQQLGQDTTWKSDVPHIEFPGEKIEANQLLVLHSTCITYITSKQLSMKLLLAFLLYFCDSPPPLHLIFILFIMLKSRETPQSYKYMLINIYLIFNLNESISILNFNQSAEEQVVVLKGDVMLLGLFIT